MKISEVQKIVGARVWSGADKLEVEVYSGCGCDLMSDVLAFAKERIVLLTGLINLQVVRTAEMLDIKAIIFVRGKVPSEDMIQLAKEKEMILLSTEMPLYEACGKLYKAGLKEEE